MYKLSKEDRAAVLRNQEDYAARRPGEGMGEQVARAGHPAIAGLEESATLAERNAIYERVIAAQRSGFIAQNGSEFGDELSAGMDAAPDMVGVASAPTVVVAGMQRTILAA